VAIVKQEEIADYSVEAEVECFGVRKSVSMRIFI
jgi:hypothetical protein